MKTFARISFLLLLFSSQINPTYAQPNTWTQKTSCPGAARTYAAGFSIGSKGYMGTGSASFVGKSKDFWEYNPGNDTWTRRADFGGTKRMYATGFSIGTKGYIVCGMDSIGDKNDLWEYDPSNDTWTKKADFPGGARSGGVAFTIGSKAYYGLGNGSVMQKDLWEYNPSLDTWTKKADFGGDARILAEAFAIGIKGYVGPGTSWGNGGGLWEYDPSSDAWTQKTDSSRTSEGIGFSIGQKGYIGLGMNSSQTGELWEYNPVNNTCIRKAPQSSLTRTGAVAFTIGNYGYITTGEDFYGQYKNDIWKYTPDSLIPNTITPGAIGSQVCAGLSIRVPYSITGSFVSGNSFTAQLSNASGSFSNPLNVGTIARIAADTIIAFIPDSISAGSGYHVRVISSNPAFTGATNASSIIINARPALLHITGDTIVNRNTTKPYAVTNVTGSTYLWQMNNGTGTSTTNTINITWATIGAAQIKIIETSVAGCRGDTAKLNVKVNPGVGIDELKNNKSIKMYPNPSNGYLNFEHTLNGEILLEVSDMNGRIIKKYTFNQKEILLNMTDLDEGLYFISASSGNEKFFIARISIIK